MAKVNATGRSMSDPHVRLFARMTNTPAWLHLSGNAIKLLLHVAAYDNGQNNGAIFMSVRRASEGTGLDRKTVMRGFVELQEKGFLRQVTPGSFKIKRSPAAQWRLTWKTAPPLSMGPTNDYRVWREKKRGGNNSQERGENLHHVTGDQAPTGGETPPDDELDPQKTAKPDLGKKGTQIIATTGASPLRGCIADWWVSATGKQRVALASKAGVSPGELKAFVANDIDLDIGKQVALRTAIAGPTGKVA